MAHDILGGIWEDDETVKLNIDLEREQDDRWIAEVLELPGVMCYGATREDAISNVERLAIEVIADRIAHGELEQLRARCFLCDPG